MATAEAVLEELEQDDFDEYDEPMMPGSDEEFSDLEDIEDDDDDDAAHPDLPPNDAPSSSSDTLNGWSSTLSPFTIPSFSSPVGPTVDIPPVTS